MSGFGNIGTGLAGFMQGFQNSQREAAQRALQQQALDQILRSNLASRLLANTSFGGGLNGTPTPQPSMPGTPSVPSFPQGGSGGAPPIPPAPAAPPPVPQAPTLPPAAAEILAGHDIFATPGQPQPFGDDTPIPPPPMQGEQIDGSRPIMRQELPPPEKPEPADAAPAPKGLQQPLSEAEYQRQYPDGILGPPGGFHTPAGSATTAPTPSGSAGPGGGGTEQASAAGGSPDRSSLFQQLLDPNHAYKALGEMRDRIAAGAPPGTDPAVIWEATQQLYKLTNGGATERAQLAAYLKMAGLDVKQQEGALNRGSREKIVGEQIAGREKLQGTAIAAGEKKQERQFTHQELMEDRKQQAINERQDRRLAQSLEIANRKLAASPNNPEIKRYKAQLDAIKAQRDGILAKSRVKTPAPSWFGSAGALGLSDEEKKKVDELNQQIEGVAKQIAGSK